MLKTTHRIAIATAGFSGIVIAIFTYPVPSIEGIWRSPFHLNCMCSSYDFAKFRDGVITIYSDKHESAVRVGHYLRSDNGSFEVKFDQDPVDEPGWIVKPRLFHWFVPFEPSTAGSRPPGSNRLFARLFYRPFSTRRAELIVAAGPRRNTDDGTEGR